MKKQVLYFIGFTGLMLASCKRESTTWNTDWTAPLVNGRLTINDIVPVDMNKVNDDGYLSIIIDRSVFAFSLDTLLDLPDTTISQRLSTGLPSATFDPGDNIVYQYDQQYTLGDIELKSLLFKEGTATIDVLSPWGGALKVDFSLPNTTNGDGVLTRLYFLDAGTETEQANGVDVIDLSGYTMEMTGLDNNQYNTFTGRMDIASNETTESFTVTNLDSITFDFSFNDLVADYARGYFGQYEFNDTSGIDLSFMDRLVDGNVDLDSIRLDLSIRNGFNLVAQAKITKLTGINSRTGSTVELDFPEKNTTLNINRADGGLYDYVPSAYPLTINNANSNILAFLENLSDSIEIGYALEINPFGNVTGGDDEIFPGSKMELYVKGEFPLNFGANNLTIQDTLDFDWKNEATEVSPQSAVLFMDYENTFPIGAEAKFYLLDDNNVVLDSLVSNTSVLTSSYNAASLETTASVGTLMFTLPSGRVENIDAAKKMVLDVSFTTYEGNKVKITPESYFDFKLRSDLNLKFSL